MSDPTGPLTDDELAALSVKAPGDLEDVEDGRELVPFIHRMVDEISRLREEETEDRWHRAVLRRHLAAHGLEDPTWRNLSEQEKAVLRARDERVLAESGRRLPGGMWAA